jgi:hypothetical protein
MNFYESVDVWKRVSRSELVRYRCFRNVVTNKYSVQSSDFYRLPLDPAQAANLEKQFLELLAEQAPDERAEAEFGSLAEAIEAHDLQFGSL